MLADLSNQRNRLLSVSERARSSTPSAAAKRRKPAPSSPAHAGEPSQLPHAATPKHGSSESGMHERLMALTERIMQHAQRRGLSTKPAGGRSTQQQEPPHRAAALGPASARYFLEHDSEAAVEAPRVESRAAPSVDTSCEPSEPLHRVAQLRDCGPWNQRGEHALVGENGPTGGGRHEVKGRVLSVSVSGPQRSSLLYLSLIHISEPTRPY